MKTGLVIDDIEDITISVELFFQANGMEVFSSETLKEGLEIIHENNLSFILTDLHLPNLDENALISTLKEATQVPIFVMTGGNKEINEFNIPEAIKKLDVSDIFIKPLDYEHMLKKITEHID